MDARTLARDGTGTDNLVSYHDLVGVLRKLGTHHNKSGDDGDELVAIIPRLVAVSFRSISSGGHPPSLGTRPPTTFKVKNGDRLSLTLMPHKSRESN